MSSPDRIHLKYADISLSKNGNSRPPLIYSNQDSERKQKRINRNEFIMLAASTAEAIFGEEASKSTK
jgi:predicted ArsR family transcriptional regulator